MNTKICVSPLKENFQGFVLLAQLYSCPKFIVSEKSSAPLALPRLIQILGFLILLLHIFPFDWLYSLLEVSLP